MKHRQRGLDVAILRQEHHSDNDDHDYDDDHDDSDDVDHDDCNDDSDNYNDDANDAMTL